MASSTVGLHTDGQPVPDHSVQRFHLCPQAATKKQKYEKISEKKMSTPVEVLCKVCEILHPHSKAFPKSPALYAHACSKSFAQFKDCVATILKFHGHCHLQNIQYC